MARTNAHILFRDKISQDFYIVSDYSIEFVDYLTLEESGKVERLFTGTKKECKSKQDELTEEFATLEM